MPTTRIACMVVSNQSGPLCRDPMIGKYQSSIEYRHGTAAHPYESPKNWSHGKSEEHAAVKPANADVSVTFARAIGSVRRCKRHEEDE